MIRLDRVSKTFPGQTTPAVAELSFDIDEGEIVVLVGPSGCGKTTTLKMINRLVEATSGTISVAGTDITSVPAPVLRQGIGYVIQRIGLFPHRTIAENIATVPALLGWEKDRINQRVDELIVLVGLTPEMKTRYPAELSGGQQQRVGVARALAADPPVLLMDEPFGAVDPIVRGRLQEELLDLQRRVHKTIVFVTHDIDEAIKLGDRVAILNVGGILEQYASPAEILRSPANRFVEEFLGEDRSLKRLSLTPISDVDLVAGPIVEPTATRGDVEATMKEHGVDWVGVGTDGRLHGWVWGEDVTGTAGDLEPRPFSVRLSADRSLREALDSVVSSHTGVAIVDDGDRYLGMLSIEEISRHLIE
ncbi:MAG: ATP-binding cassette domain-containing protein [Acidimicrobiia bacterium]|nr:ATP-binding cassette domain-containing protein [Acidimicrobiia bacterium]